MLAMLARIWKNDNGATALEYGLIAVLVAIGGAVMLPIVGENIGSTFGTIAEALSTGRTTSGAPSARLTVIVKDQEKPASKLN